MSATSANVVSAEPASSEDPPPHAGAISTGTARTETLRIATPPPYEQNIALGPGDCVGVSQTSRFRCLSRLLSCRVSRINLCRGSRRSVAGRWFRMFKLNNEGEIKMSLGDWRRRTTDALPLRDVPLPVRDFLFGQVSRAA